MRRTVIAALTSLAIAACSGGPPGPTGGSPTGGSPSGGATSSPPPSTTTPQAGVNEGGNTWQATAQSFSDRTGERFIYHCPPDGVNWFVYGTDVYTSDSSVCTAAVHASLITLADGGDVVIEMRPGQDSYTASSRNGISSQGYAAWPASYVFVIGGQAPTPSPAASATSTTGSASASANAGEYLQPGALLVCMPFGRARFAERDASGQTSGVDVEIGEALAAQLGRSAQLLDTPFEELIDAIEQRRCDLTIGGQFITQGRLERIDMIPYRQGAPHVVVRAGNPLAIDELVDLCGRRFAVVTGTVYVDMVAGTGDYVGQGLDDSCAGVSAAPVDLREFELQSEAEQALADGDVDAYAGNDFIVQDQPSVYELAVELPVVRNGIGHLLGANWVDAEVRTALRAIIASGAYADILERYGVASVALTELP